MTKEQALEKSLRRMLFVFGDLATRGCKDRTYKDWQNGNGVDIGKQMDGAIKRAKEVLKRYDAPTSKNKQP